MDVNKVILLGRVGTDPELKMFGDPERSMCRISVATGHYNKKTKKTLTTWHNCISWDKIGENVAKYITKGRKVYLEGEIRNNNWKDKDGVQRYGMDIVVRTITMVDSSKDFKEGTDHGPSDADKPDYVKYDGDHELEE